MQVICITGPTCSGKTTLLRKTAEELRKEKTVLTLEIGNTLRAMVGEDFLLKHATGSINADLNGCVHELIRTYIRCAAELNVDLLIEGFPRTVQQARVLRIHFLDKYSTSNHLSIWCVHAPWLTMKERSGARSVNQHELFDKVATEDVSNIKEIWEMNVNDQPWFNMEQVKGYDDATTPN